MRGGIGVSEREPEGGYLKEKTGEIGFSQAKRRRERLQWRHALSVWFEPCWFETYRFEPYYFLSTCAASQIFSGHDEGVALCVPPHKHNAKSFLPIRKSVAC